MDGRCQQFTISVWWEKEQEARPILHRKFLHHLSSQGKRDGQSNEKWECMHVTELMRRSDDVARFSTSNISLCSVIKNYLMLRVLIMYKTKKCLHFMMKLRGVGEESENYWGKLLKQNSKENFFPLTKRCADVHVTRHRQRWVITASEYRILNNRQF